MSDVQPRRLQAQKLVTLTEAMRELARSGEWGAFAHLHGERENLVRDLFGRPVPPEAAGFVSECIHQVMRIDRELLLLAEAGRDEAARALRELKSGQQGTDAYLRFSR
jgi:hypothetical protein